MKIFNDVGIVYCAKNKLNNKCYIGQTKNKFSIRQYHHFYNALKSKDISKINKCSVFYNAIRKYGKDNFEWSILEETIPKLDLLVRESFFIIKLNTLSPNGYNLKIEAGPYKCVSNETKEKLRITSTGKYHSEETKIQISENRKGKSLGKDNGFYGKKPTTEVKNRQSNYDQNIYYFRNKKTDERFTGKIFEFCEKYNLIGNSINIIKQRNILNIDVDYTYKNWAIYNDNNTLELWINKENKKPIKIITDAHKISLNRKGTNQTEETKKRISESTKGVIKSKDSERYDQNIYIFKHRLTLEEYTGKVHEFCEKYNIEIYKFSKIKNNYFNNAVSNWNIFTDIESMNTELRKKYFSFNNKVTNELYNGSILGFCHKYDFNNNAIQVLKNKKDKNPIINYTYKNWSINET